MKINLKNYDVFIFDWDGTLISLKLILRINEKAKRFFKKLKILKNKVYPNKNLNTLAVDFIDIKNKDFLKKEEFKNTILSFIIDLFFIFSKPKIHKDCIAILQKLKENNKKIVLFSNGGEYRIKKELNYFKVNDYFNLVISARTLKALKPNSIGIRLISKYFKIKNQKMLFIGDSVDDMISGKNAGIDVCAIHDGFDSLLLLKKVKPKFIFRSIEEFYKNLN